MGGKGRGSQGEEGGGKGQVWKGVVQEAVVDVGGGGSSQEAASWSCVTIRMSEKGG